MPIDAHTHVNKGSGRNILASPCEGVGDFFGFHPWYLEDFDAAKLAAALERNPKLGVGEIGLDRLKAKTISPKMRDAFLIQLELAAKYQRPVVLHGAKCWGEVVKMVRPFAAKIPAMLFHGFSRSPGLIPEIVALNGYISVGPAVLNDHAVNYRALVKALPLERVLVETDAVTDTLDNAVDIVEIAAMTAKIKNLDESEFVAIVNANTERFMHSSLRIKGEK